MALIAFDTSGSNYSDVGTTATVNLAATGSNRLAIIFACADFPIDPVVQVNGSATGVVEIGRITLTGNQKIICYYFLSPSTSSVAYTCFSANQFIGLSVQTYTGASQSGVPDSSASKTGDTSPLDLTTSVVATGCWLLSAGRNYSTGVISASTGTTLRENPAPFASGDSNGSVGTGSQTMNWTSPSGNMGGIIISISPFVAPPVNGNFLMFM